MLFGSFENVCSRSNIGEGRVSQSNCTNTESKLPGKHDTMCDLNRTIKLLGVHYVRFQGVSDCVSLVGVILPSRV